MCVNYIKKKKHHTHTYWYFPDFSLSLCLSLFQRGSGEQANWQMSKPKAAAIFELLFFFSYLFVLYKRSDADVNGNVEGGVA